MKFIIASSSERKVGDVSQLLQDLAPAVVRLGPIAKVSAGCDAGIIHYTVAHDRYGGVPIVGRAQVLRNLENDGAPPVIVTTPPLESGAGMVSGQMNVEIHAMRMISVALAEWAQSSLYPRYSPEVTCLIHLEAAGLDFGDLNAMVQGIRRVIVDDMGQSAKSAGSK